MAIKDLSDEELAAKMSHRSIWLENAYEEMASRMDEKAGEDRCGQWAQWAITTKSLFHRFKAVHAEASVLECQVTGKPLVRSGER